MPFDLGDVVPLTIDIKDANGDPANATSVTLTITLPDATVITPGVNNPSTGRYQFDYPTVQPGRHAVRWVATGSNAGAHTETFDVRPASPNVILSMAEAKAALNVNTDKDHEEIRGHLESITDAIEFLVGPVVRKTVVERHTPGPYLVLRASPVISLTSVTGIPSGSPTYDVSDMDIDPATGILTFLDGRSFTVPVRVTFVAGRTVVPAAIREASVIMLIHMWNVQRGSGGLPSVAGRGADGDYTLRQSWEPPVPGFGFSIPNRALELLAPYLLPPDGG